MRLMTTQPTPTVMITDNIGTYRRVGEEEQHLRSQMKELRVQIESADKFIVAERKRLAGTDSDVIRVRMKELTDHRDSLIARYTSYHNALHRAVA